MKIHDSHENPAAPLCRRQEAAIEMALQGRISQERARILVHHLQSCPSCHAYLRWAQTHDEALRGLLAHRTAGPRGLAGCGSSGAGPFGTGAAGPHSIDLEEARRRLVALLAAESANTLAGALLRLAHWLFHHRSPGEALLYPGRLPPPAGRVRAVLSRALEHVAATPLVSSPLVSSEAGSPANPASLAPSPFGSIGRATPLSLANAIRLARWSAPAWLGRDKPSPGTRLALAGTVTDEVLSLDPTLHEARLLRMTIQRAEGYPEPELLEEDQAELERCSDRTALARSVSRQAAWMIESAGGTGGRHLVRRALKTLEQALEIDPDRPDALFNCWHLSGLTGERTRRRRATTRLHRLEQSEPPGPALANRRVEAARACLAAGRPTTIEEW